MLAGAVIDELEARAPVASRTLYFFFRQEPMLDNSTALYRSLLTQILNHCHDDEVFDRFAFAMKYSPTAQPTGTRQELYELLLLCTEIIGQHYIVLDGIDECRESASLVGDLTRLGSHSSLIFFSRPNVRALQEIITRDQCIFIGRSNADDIRMFLKRKLENLFDREMLPGKASIRDYTEHLTLGADGMFLWARLMMEYLESEALSDQDRHDTILAVGMPERLSVMYLRIIRLIAQGCSANRKMAKWIIMWLTFAKRPLTAAELEESTKLLNEANRARPGRRDFDKAIIMVCASLVEKATLHNAGDIPCFRFIHSTVQEYFLELFTQDGMSGLPEDVRRDVSLATTPTPHSEICRSCLQYMLYHMPAQSLSQALGYEMEALINNEDMMAAFPFSSYAMALWIDHLQASKDEVLASNQAISPGVRNLFETLNRFLGEVNVVKVWIEATYILDFRHDDKVELLGTWGSDIIARFGSLSHDMTTALDAAESLVRYMTDLDKYWGATLRVCPGRLWAWAQFSNQSSTIVRSLFADHPSQAGTTLSNQYLCKVSASTSEYVGTLSIWTSP
jgi:hypothetical protein